MSGSEPAKPDIASPSAIRAFMARMPQPGVRSLVSDFFMVHLVFTAFVGLLAVGALWWTSQWVIEDNMRNWAVQWVTRLDSLGAPLYASDRSAEFSRVEQYARRFPEIAFVRYYDAEGELLQQEYSNGGNLAEQVPNLTEEQIGLLQDGLDDEDYVLDERFGEGHRFRASTSLWAESIASDGLLAFDLEGDTSHPRTLLGFVELGLDFDEYGSGLTSRVLNVGVAIMAGVFLLAVAGRFAAKRALSPLSQLHEPLHRLASGDMEFDLQQGGHTEIKAINTALVSTITALQERDRKLRRLANYDPLTGLMSRRGFEEQLDADLLEIESDDEPAALLFIDLDQFKYVNDTAGHAAGDRLLVRVAETLRSSLRDQDLVCRFGGDEFTILARHVTQTDANTLAQQLLDAMAEINFVENGHPFQVLCSIGVTIVRSNNYTATELIEQADLACHEAKANGRNRHEFYRAIAADEEQAATDMGWSRRIADALENDRFTLQFQPIIDIQSRSPVLYEVLLRMRAGDKIIAPGAFLPAAHRFGFMVDIDYWVIRQALETLAQFRQGGHEVSLALNLSGVVFDDRRVVDYVREHLDRNQIPASSVVFEITEQIAIRYVADANKIIGELKEMGCSFALDDFGAGFSSFNYLKQLPMDYLKIDGTFIENIDRDETNQAMVRSMVQIASAVNMKTIAEYVMNDASLAKLEELGVDFAQGFHIARPDSALALGPFTHVGAVDNS